MTRCFVAAWPSAEVRAALTELVAVAPLAGERRVPSENWHVTLRFVGDADLADVAERLGETGFPAADAVLGPAVTDLDGRLVVVPVTGVDSLASAVASATEGIGRPGRRAFFGHLTLARLPAGGTSDLLGTQIESSFRVDRISLVRSETLPTGAVYTTVASFPTVRSSTGDAASAD